MRAKISTIFAVGFILLGALAAQAPPPPPPLQDVVPPPPSDAILDNIESWPVEGFTCEQLSEFRLGRDSAKCSDLSAVILPAVVGAQENYINGCLSNLVDTQIALSKKCELNIEYRPTFVSFENSFGISDEEVKLKSDTIYEHCKSMGSHLQWFTECGSPEHHNSCVKTYDWYFTEYLSLSLKKKVEAPFVPLPPGCGGGEISGPTPEQQKCITRAENEIHRIEKRCMGRTSQMNTPLCVWYKKRDACRSKGDIKAQEYSQICGYPVIIYRTMDTAPYECESCGETGNLAIQGILSQDLSQMTNDCDRWNAGMHVITKYYKELNKFKKLCGSKGLIELAIDPAMMPEGCRLEKPRQCERRARRSIDLTNSNCHLKAQKQEKFCDQFRESVQCWSQQANLAQKWSLICGIEMMYPIPSLAFPIQCSGDWNDDLQCALDSSGKIWTKVNSCMDQKKTMRFANECGSVSFDNSCAIDAINDQLQYFEDCKWNLPEYYPAINTSNNCSLENCSEKAGLLIFNIQKKCKQSVSMLEISECEKARRENECLHRFDYVALNFNQLCVENSGLQFNYIDETSVCQDISNPDPATP